MNSEHLTDSPARFSVAPRPPLAAGGHVGAWDGFAVGVPASNPMAEESLVVDDRSSLSPAELVEGKLSRMLKETSLPVSHLQMRGMVRQR